jgi:hypothetical protein
MRRHPSPWAILAVLVFEIAVAVQVYVLVKLIV